MPTSIELGLDTFGDATVDASGQQLSQAQALRNLVDYLQTHPEAVIVGKEKLKEKK